MQHVNGHYSYIRNRMRGKKPVNDVASCSLNFRVGIGSGQYQIFHRLKFTETLC